ncbi:two-component system response regulator YesN [Paenibacillus endophyticus]|uniref:Two-component system response regulator YesN n=1 Tax=Paenibacillus endophyticus TaxID=1294268 RepID=A0A7W5CA25_9BACL|nr:response regulator [Paenibacillus endophyticus]MBB3153465.1 two-component system response regulator YesN [Paenibacillus endophyticus]
MKVIIVDDEKLVRRGLISIMPWSKYQMEVVGEAGNGRKALELLEQQDVDIVFTDLMMPEMSGFELMEAMSEKYPGKSVVVLSCHEEFAYAQKAIRMGALDYVVKNDLETDTMDEVLRRIARTYEERNIKKQAPDKKLFDRAMVVLKLGDDEQAAKLVEKLSAGNVIHYLDRHCWFFALDSLGPEQEKTLIADIKQASCLPVLVHGLGGITLGETVDRLHAYLSSGLLYDYKHWVTFWEWAADKELEWVEPEKERLGLRWNSPDWIYSNEEYELLLQDTVALRLPMDELKKLLFPAFLENGRLLLMLEWSMQLIFRLEPLRMWEEWKTALEEERGKLRSIVCKSKYGDDIVRVIYKAIRFMHEQEEMNFSQHELAGIANMSRTYFSQCFKNVTGKSFNDYATEIRMSKAQQLLVHTNTPIYQIAQLVGFKDEKYFSKLFLQEIGMLPSDFRNRNAI